MKYSQKDLGLTRDKLAELDDQLATTTAEIARVEREVAEASALFADRDHEIKQVRYRGCGRSSDC